MLIVWRKQRLRHCFENRKLTNVKRYKILFTLVILATIGACAQSFRLGPELGQSAIARGN